MYSCLDSASTNSQGNRIGKFDVVDLDPYGTAAPFLDAAVQGAKDGGLLCVTCTDSGVFASCGYSEKTFSLYGGMPVKGPYSHEAGLRLIIHSLCFFDIFSVLCSAQRLCVYVSQVVLKVAMQRHCCKEF